MDLPTPLTGHVFISYTREDQPYTRKLADTLRKCGLEVWMDDRIDFGDRWWQTVVQAIRASAAFVVVMTPDAEKSEWVEREVMVALDEGKPIFPLLLRGRRFPLLVTTQYADVTGGRMPPDDFYERLEREVRAQSKEQSKEEVVAPLAPEPTVRKDRAWIWQRLRLPLEVVGLLALLGLIVLIGLLVIKPWQRADVPTPVATALIVLPPSPTPPPLLPTPTPTDTPIPEPPTGTPVPEPTETPTPIPISYPPSSGSLHDTWTRPPDGMEIVYVPGGTFEMGSTDGEYDEQPVHKVMLDSFWIDRTEVTNSQYARCVADSICSPPFPSGSATRDSYYGDGQFDDYPVIYVDWEDADTYCQWAGGRLPTEAEWEYAARGPDGNDYPWGNNEPTSSLANYHRIDGDTTAVGSYPSGASWLGAMDMAGNVWEWVADWYDPDYYAISPSQNPQGPETGDQRMLRGGSWPDAGELVRAAYRNDILPDFRDVRVGFRCVIAPGE